MSDAGADDVLCALRTALRRGVSLAWAVEHAAIGDPIPAAWAACQDDWLMQSVLGHAVRTDLARLAWDALGAHWRTCPERRGSPCCAAAVREAVPTLTLADVVDEGGEGDV